MLKSCCFCCNLYQGSIVVALTRIIHWLLVFAASLYVAFEVFSLDYQIMEDFNGKAEIEQNGKKLTRLFIA